MAQTGERYRKLPGRRRGILFGASVWLGSDHLLLVKSSRFREEYKRFYFRDVQSIVTAASPRFHISTRMGLIAAIWLAIFAAASAYDTGSLSRFHLTWVLWAIAVGLVAAWVYVSAVSSCRCRILTAVSSEELPSLYRTWTARRFLAAVEPFIAQTQGTIEGNWAEAVEDRQVGPLVEGRAAVSMPALRAMPALAPQPVGPQLARTPVSLLFVASLFLGGLADLLTLRIAENSARWVLLGFILLQIGTAVAVLIQNYRGILRPALRILAIVTLVAIGVWYYAVQMAAGMAISLESAQRRAKGERQPEQRQLAALTLINYPWSRGAAGAVSLVLGIAGVVVLLRKEQPEGPTSFNV